VLNGEVSETLRNRAETARGDAPNLPPAAEATTAQFTNVAAGATLPAVRIAGRRKRLRLALRPAAWVGRRPAARRVHLPDSTRSPSS
jgi:hypothetical protein